MDIKRFLDERLMEIFIGGAAIGLVAGMIIHDGCKNRGVNSPTTPNQLEKSIENEEIKDASPEVKAGYRIDKTDYGVVI